MKGKLPQGTTAAKKARDVMNGGTECVGEKDSILDAAKRLRELDVGAMPICGGMGASRA